MKYFVRPSKSEFMKIENEIKLISEFIDLIDQRSKILTQEKERLKITLEQKKNALLNTKEIITLSSEYVQEKHGQLHLQRIASVAAKDLKLKRKYEYIAGVKYYFPYIISSDIISYPTSLTGFDIDNLRKETKLFLENIVSFAKYVQAYKKLSEELKLIRRKLNILQNIILPDLKKNKKKIKKYLNEKDRFDTVFKMNIINKVRKQ